MNAIDTVRQRLEQDGSLADLLDAAYDAFEVVTSVIWDHLDTDENFSTALVFAAGAAADGRDEIAAAPSLPARPAREMPGPRPRLTPGGSTEDLAAALADLSQALGTRLADAAGSARDLADRAASGHGARAAQEISALLTWDPP